MKNDSLSQVHKLEAVGDVSDGDIDVLDNDITTATVRRVRGHPATRHGEALAYLRILVGCCYVRST